jgi:SAM-dependent methyltransferase
MRMRWPGVVALVDEEVAMAGPAEVWAVGSSYEAYVGRWSRLVARELIAWLEVAGGAAWLDVGCGTGALGHTVLGAADPAQVVGLDPSAGFVAHARERLAGPRARFRDFDDCWTPFLGGQGPAPGYAVALDEPRRALLGEELRARLPAAPDGSIPLVARAWAARGVARPRAGAGGGGPWTA